MQACSSFLKIAKIDCLKFGFLYRVLVLFSLNGRSYIVNDVAVRIALGLSKLSFALRKSSIAGFWKSAEHKTVILGYAP
ncbi:MAG: hypothetical protein COC08_07005 [Maribacter sp.]|nr:MAG: hypothetical protein COC08_07005 [Maribacter sp.]